MINDKHLIPLCKRLASRFVRQAAHLGAPDDVFDELVNVAYAAGKARSTIGEAHTWIMWELIHYVVMPMEAVDKLGVRIRRGCFRTVDLRRRYLDATPSASDEVEKKDELVKLFNLIMSLGHDDVIIICLRFGRERSFKEIGEIFNRSGWWASMRITKILERLRKELENVPT